MLDWWRLGLIGPVAEARTAHKIMSMFAGKDTPPFEKVFPGHQKLIGGSKPKVGMFQAIRMMRE